MFCIRFRCYLEKPVLQKLDTLQFPSPSELGFQVQEPTMTNLKVGKKCFHIHMPFSPEPPFSTIH